jgi:hypothetical protein
MVKLIAKFKFKFEIQRKENRKRKIKGEKPTWATDPIFGPLTLSPAQPNPTHMHAPTSGVHLLVAAGVFYTHDLASMWDPLRQLSSPNYCRLWRGQLRSLGFPPFSPLTTPPRL